MNRPTDTSIADDERRTPFHLLDLEFAGAMCETWAEGLKGDRRPNNWKKLPWDRTIHDKYVGAIMRHLREYLSTTDPERRRQAMAAIGCNANILWYYSDRKIEQ